MQRMLTITTPAGATALTTLAAVKGELALAATADDEVLLQSLIEQASEAIAAHCQRVFGRESLQETQWLGDELVTSLVLARYPVVSLSGVTVDGAALTGGDYKLDGANGRLLRSGVDRLARWSGTVVVDYQAGYLLPGMSGSRDLPADLERAAIELVKSYWHARRRDPALASETLPEVYAVRYRDADGGCLALPAQVRQLLAPYLARRA
jgi:uncharacterized phiE125 gp8 family phage protein